MTGPERYLLFSRLANMARGDETGDVFPREAGALLLDARLKLGENDPAALGEIIDMLRAMLDADSMAQFTDSGKRIVLHAVCWELAKSVSIGPAELLTLSVILADAGITTGPVNMVDRDIP